MTITGTPRPANHEVGGMDVAITDQHDRVSDYGSDFTPDEEEILSILLPTAPKYPITDPDLVVKDIGDDEGPRGARVLRRLGHEQVSDESLPTHIYKRKGVQIQIDGDSSRIVESTESRVERERSNSIEAPLDPVPETPDLRSPLERFRTKPKKALSVTDLVSPSWCELQYWYTLTKHGRKRRTPAMRQGSAVHKILEDQVHRTVAVDIISKEDAWGLRIWNIIQGLKTLRDTGMTRELEIWGVIDGLVVNGVIDELSTICPDRELEQAEEKRTITKETPATDQTTITDFLGPSALENKGTDTIRNHHSLLIKKPKIYLTDVKTRGAKVLPKGASFRPTLMQLMLYHRLLSSLATNKVDPNTLFNRYALDPEAPFSDAFIAQIGNLHQSEFPDASSSLFEEESHDPTDSSQDSTTILLNHNSLRQLWTLMISNFAHTFPQGATSIGRVLKAEYRSQSDGELIGAKSFLYDEAMLQEYLEEEMKWWRGERAAQGVCVEEAYKCGSCDFAPECSWRKNKIEESTGRMRERLRSVV